MTLELRVQLLARAFDELRLKADVVCEYLRVERTTLDGWTAVPERVPLQTCSTIARLLELQAGDNADWRELARLLNAQTSEDIQQRLRQAAFPLAESTQSAMRAALVKFWTSPEIVHPGQDLEAWLAEVAPYGIDPWCDLVRKDDV